MFGKDKKDDESNEAVKTTRDAPRGSHERGSHEVPPPAAKLDAEPEPQPAPVESAIGPQGEVRQVVPSAFSGPSDMKVRAKFRCLGVDQQPGDNGYALRFEAVTEGSRENKDFFRWTPSGQLTMGVVSEETAKKFTAGASYYLDFTPAP